MKVIKITYEVTKCQGCPFENKEWLSQKGNRYYFRCKLTGTTFEANHQIQKDCPIVDDEVYEYPIQIQK